MRHFHEEGTKDCGAAFEGTDVHVLMRSIRVKIHQPRLGRRIYFLQKSRESPVSDLNRFFFSYDLLHVLFPVCQPAIISVTLSCSFLMSCLRLLAHSFASRPHRRQVLLSAPTVSLLTASGLS